MADDPKADEGQEHTEHGEQPAPEPISRREMLERTGIAVAGLLVGCGDDDGAFDASMPQADGGATDAAQPDAGPEDMGAPDARVPPDGGMDAVRALPLADSFALGVASGDATADSVVVWTRYDGDDSLTLVVWDRLEDGTDGARALEQSVTPDANGFVHESVAIVAGRRYAYAFVEGGTARSRIGRFRAAIADDALEPLVFGAVSCTSNGRAFETLERAGEREDLDAFLLLGDTTYNDGATTIEDFRAKWAENFATEGYLATRAATSLLATWDDHEIDNNWNPESTDPATVAAGTQAFFEHLPLERLAEDESRLWRRRRWGQTLEVFVLDCRGERKPSTRTGPDAEYVSPEQLAWLKAGLADSPAVFKVIMNSVGITDFPFLLDAAAADRWEGYAAQRESLLQFIEDGGISGILWVSGDFHFASLGSVAPSGELGSNQFEVLVGPGGQTANPVHLSLTGDRWLHKGGTNNYTELRFDPEAGSVRIRFIDGGGDVIADETITP